MTSSVATISKKKEIVKSNFEKLSEIRKGVLSNPEVVEALSAKEYEAALSSVHNGKNSTLTINRLEDQELIDEIQKIIQVIVKDLGIHNYKESDAQYDSSRLFKYLRSYYYDLTCKEVVVAFEYLMLGELDQFLPQSHGKPDRGHYQKFSVDFITKVLNAFKFYKNKVWSKANGSIPEVSKTITEVERKEARRTFLDDIYLKFDQFVESNKEPFFLAPVIVVDELVKNGIVTGLPEVTEQDRKLALHKFMSSSIVSKYQKWKVDKDSEELHSTIKGIQYKKVIRMVFEQAKTKGLDIREIIK
jgi:hypothetical protein